MDLVRSWLGQALRATGAAVVVPIAVLLALSLSALGGGSGLGGLGALSQIVSGPGLAGADLSIDSGETEIGSAVTQLAAGGDPGPGGAAVPGPGGGPPPGGGPGDGDGDGGPGDDRDPGGSVPPPGEGGPDPAPPGGGGGGGGGGETPPPPEPPGLVENVGQGVTDVTDGTPVAPTVEDAVDTLIDTCRRAGCP